jgi:hypothetical protein
MCLPLMSQSLASSLFFPLPSRTRTHQHTLHMSILTSVILVLLAYSADGLSLGPTKRNHQETSSINRRFVLNKISSFGLAAPFITPNANAVDAQFAEVGQQEKPPNGESPFVKLSSGVQIKDFCDGTGAKVEKGSKVELTLKGRLLNLNGVSTWLLIEYCAAAMYSLSSIPCNALR